MMAVRWQPRQIFLCGHGGRCVGIRTACPKLPTSLQVAYDIAVLRAGLDPNAGVSGGGRRAEAGRRDLCPIAHRDSRPSATSGISQSTGGGAAPPWLPACSPCLNRLEPPSKHCRPGAASAGQQAAGLPARRPIATRTALLAPHASPRLASGGEEIEPEGGTTRRFGLGDEFPPRVRPCIRGPRQVGTITRVVVGEGGPSPPRSVRSYAATMTGPQPTP